MYYMLKALEITSRQTKNSSKPIRETIFTANTFYRNKSLRIGTSKESNFSKPPFALLISRSSLVIVFFLYKSGEFTYNH